MKILYANVIELHAGWGAEWFVDRGLRGLGHQTHCIDYRKHRTSLDARFAQAGDYDVFFLQRGDGFPLELLRTLHPPRLFWASELVSRCRDQDRLLASGLFDHIFFHSTQCLETAVSRGWITAERASVLLNGFDPQLHRPNRGRAKNIDILFAGSLTPRREEWLQRLRRRFPVQVVSAFGAELIDWINRARIELNLHAEEHADTETRVFEVLGCGGFLLTERLSPDSPFSSRHFVAFDTFDELCRQADHFLRHESERQSIAEAGHKEALAKHTYDHRARYIVGVMQEKLTAAGMQVAPKIGELIPPPRMDDGCIPFARTGISAIGESTGGIQDGTSRLPSSVVTNRNGSGQAPGKAGWTLDPLAVEAYLVACERACGNEGFGDFKRVPAYCRVLEHVNQEQGQAYLDAVLAESPGLRQHFARFAENDRLGHPYVFRYGDWDFSPTTLRYVKVLADLLRLFGSLADLDIIEIGGGYGGQCKIIADAAKCRSYTLVDLPQVSRLQERYLAALGVPMFRCLLPEQLEDRDYDLAISSFAISELDDNAQAFYTTAVLNRSKRGYLVWNNEELPKLLHSPQVAPERPATGRHNRTIAWGTRTP